MPHPLLDLDHLDVPAPAYLPRIGEVFATFDQQDSGNVSYGVRVAGDRFFVKTIGAPEVPAHLDADERSALLRNAAVLATRVEHPALPVFERLIESPQGPVLVYRWADGELVHVAHDSRGDPGSVFQRFRRLPPAELEAAFDVLYDLHDVLAADGWVACDLYDGCLIYDFATSSLTVIDLDTYHRGPFTNTMGRMFGATQFMAPEELTLGARIDERTTVFTLARLALAFLSEGTTDAGPFRGSLARLDVLTRATAVAPADRFPTVAAFTATWRAGGEGSGPALRSGAV